MKKLLALLVLAFATSSGAKIVMMDFEGLPTGGYYGAYVFDGFALDPGARDWTPGALPYPEGGPWTGHYHIFGPGEGNADNGTNYFVFDYFFDSSRLHVFSTNSSIFGVRQLDLAESAFAFPVAVCSSLTPAENRDGNCGVTFIGYLAEGGTITRTVTLDGVNDGGGPLVDFETFNFNGQWNRLTMFDIVASHEYLNPGLDNLELRTVPEPGTLALLGVGLAGLGFSRRKH